MAAADIINHPKSKKFSKDHQPVNRQKENPYLIAYRRKMREKVKQLRKEVDADGKVISSKMVVVSKFESLLDKAYQLAMAGNEKMLTLLINYGAGYRAAQLLVQQGMITSGKDDEHTRIFNQITVISRKGEEFVEYDELDRSMD